MRISDLEFRRVLFRSCGGRCVTGGRPRRLPWRRGPERFGTFWGVDPRVEAGSGMPLPASSIQVPGQATQRQVRSDHEMVRAEGRGSAPAFFIAYVAGVGGGGGMAAVLRGAGAGGVSRQSGRAAGGADRKSTRLNSSH